MPADTYVAPKFSIYNNITVAGLVALKGSALAVTDYIYGCNGAVLSGESDINIAGVYQGNNATLNYAGSKAFGVEMAAGTQLILNTNVASEGLSGPGNSYTGGYWKFNGTAANPCYVTGVNVGKANNNNSANCPMTATYTVFTNLGSTVCGAAHSFENCDWIQNAAGTCYGLYFDSSRKTFPTRLYNCTFTGLSIGWYDATTTSPMTYGDFFRRFSNNKFVRTATGGSIIYINPTTAGVYPVGEYSATPKRWWNILGGTR